VTAVLLLSCPDQPGVVAATAQFLADHHGNIVHAEQHVDTGTGNGDAVFFQRVEFDLEGFGLERSDILTAFSPTAERLGMNVDLRFTDTPTPTALMASKQPHCLYDLLTRWHSGELPMDLRVVVSNHPDHAGIAEHMGVPYLHLPVTPDTKPEQERQILHALADHGVDLVVMARYMQILSDRFVAAHPNRIINIHHSFLPAFVGANPYRQAFDRGVKLIGATAHYASADLDEGPIIEQDVERVDHADDVRELIGVGQDVERRVLAQAVRWHAEHRVFVNGRRTVVFH
jgi:formyltetrahydrofolate deformylase